MSIDQAEPAEPPPILRPEREETREPVTIEASVGDLDPAAAPEPTTKAPTAPVEPPHRSYKGLIGAVAALIAASGGGYWYYLQQAAPPTPPIAAISPPAIPAEPPAAAPPAVRPAAEISPPAPAVSPEDLTTLEQKLDARLTQLATSMKSATDLQQRRNADLDQSLAALKSMVDAAATPAATPPTSAPTPAIDLAPLEARIAELEKRLQALEDAEKTAKSEARATSPSEPDVAGAGRASDPAALIAIAATIVRAIDRGAPFPTALAAARAAGAPADLLPPLAAVAGKGAPSLTEVARLFAASEQAIIATGEPPTTPDASIAGRLVAAASKLVRVRATTDAGGSQPAALAARINDALKKNATDAALAAWGQLPAAAQSASTAFAEAARTRVAASAAAAALEEAAMRRLADAPPAGAGKPERAQ